jgi:hypothetical protein
MDSLGLSLFLNWDTLDFEIKNIYNYNILFLLNVIKKHKEVFKMVTIFLFQ